MDQTNTAADNLVDITSRNLKPDPRALNAYRHGLTGQVHFFASKEEEAAFQKHAKGYHASWKPVGEYETDLCQLMADTSWRLHGGGAIENSMKADLLANPRHRHCEHEQADIALDHTRVWKACSLNLDLLSRYERRLQRNLNERTKLLVEAQARRRAAEKEQELKDGQTAAENARQEGAARMKALFEAENAGLFKKADAFERAKAANFVLSEPVNFDFSKKSAPPLARSAAPPRL